MNVRPSAAGWWLLLLLALLPPAVADVPRVKLYVDAPGVYSVPTSEVAEGCCESALLTLRHRDQILPISRVLTEGQEHLAFVVPTARFDARVDGSSHIVLILSTGSRPADPAESMVPIEPEGRERAQAKIPRDLPMARAQRVRRFEHDLSRAPLDQVAAEAGVESMWYWRMISHQASSRHDLQLGDLADRRPGAEVVVRVRLLGWSMSAVAAGVPQHWVDIVVDDRRVGEAIWDGRRLFEEEFTVRGLGPAPPGGHRLTLKVRPRHEATDRAGGDSGDREEIVDLVYVDRVEVRYELAGVTAESIAVVAAEVTPPLRLESADEPRWLEAPRLSGIAAITSSGDWLADRPEGGWLVPPSARNGRDLEVWIVDPAKLRSPFAIESVTGGARGLPQDLDYVMIAPPDLLTETTRLAEHHRQRGLRVAVVDVVAIFDAFGGGEKRSEAIRLFLDELMAHHSPGLRYVLLVGDADWQRPADVAPLLEAAANRDRLPTGVRASAYGPAASDHLYAYDPAAPAVPRFAVGRLPVIDAIELAEVVDKLIAYASAPLPDHQPMLLLLSDASRQALRRRTQVANRLAASAFIVSQPTLDPVSGADQGVIEAFAQGPAVVHFGGHGSRFQWQLGAQSVAGPEAFFDRQDVARLAPARRPPVVISASCATAPFDHPSADSLGEVMVLQPDRGAIAFLGSGVRLFTPRIFSRELILAFGREATVGDAVVAAKRAAGFPHVSYLYNLLGDPATPLR